MKSATKATVIMLSTVVGIAGVEHGIGEILQGNVAPGGLIFPSWPESVFFRVVSGEPAMTIIPNLLVTGILAILFSLAFVTWAGWFVQRKHGGLVLMLLSVGWLLAGGGIFPPIIGFSTGILATKIDAPPGWWRAHPGTALRDFLRKAWPWSFGISVTAWLILFPGINILGYFFGLDDLLFTILSILFALGSSLLMVLTGLAQDSGQQPVIQAHR